MEKVITNQNHLRQPAAKTGNGSNLLNYNEKFILDDAVLSLKARVLAFTIFLYFFIENGTLGLLPSSLYFVYRSVRISDLILYALIIYSFFCIKEYIDLFKSKSFLIVKIILFYLLFEFVISAFRYKFNVIEYFFRLKGPWSSFLIFPILLLIKRNGLSFLIRLIFPIAIISNILYVLSALTGIAFLPDIMIVSQDLPGDLFVFRVYGGTFFGEMFFLGIIYYWITKRFQWYQLFFAVLFIIPHILAFGRSAWLRLTFSILVFVILNIIKKKNFKTIFRQAVILFILIVALIYSFIKFIPNSDFYIEALSARILQGQEDVEYDEGTYGERGIQNNALVKLWLNSNPIIGIGMHPMWVYRPETQQEILYYSAFSDVVWPAVLAAYGIIGIILAVIFQFYFIKTSYKIIKKSSAPSIYTFILTMFFIRLLFDTFLRSSHMFISVGLWGFGGLLGLLCFEVVTMVYCYEIQKQQDKGENVNRETPKTYGKYGRYYNSSYKVYKLRD